MKPWVYIASPYTKGDPAINTRFQCDVFDKLMNTGTITPIAPLWSHFQHTVHPRDYKDWINYDLEIIKRCDACLRLPASNARLCYVEDRSKGADAEARWFSNNLRPVFHSLEDLCVWAEEMLEQSKAARHGEGGEG